LFAIAQEANNDAAGAEQSWRAAAALAPANSQVNWALANLLLREGKMELAVEPLRAVAKYNKQLLPSLFEAMWRAANQNPAMLQAVADREPDAQFALARFLREQERAEDAVSVFRDINRQARLQSAQSAEFIDGLISARQFALA